MTQPNAYPTEVNLEGTEKALDAAVDQILDLKDRMREAHELLAKGEAYGKDATRAMLLLADDKCVHGVNLGRLCGKCRDAK